MKRVLAMLTFAILVYACQKEVVGANLPENNIASLEQFFTNNTTPLQNFKADANAFINLTTPKGTGIIFPDNAFVTLNNVPVTGDVTVEVKEILTPAEMILNNAPTTSNGLPLESGGEFYVRVTQNNEVLKLAPGKYIQIRTTNTAGVDMNGMQVFNGNMSNGVVNWTLNTNQTNFVARDSTTNNAASLFADSLQWLNIDKFINEPKITYTIDPSSSPNVDSTVVYVHLTGKNSIFRLPYGTSSFSSSNMIAATATLVGICVIDNSLYYAMLPVVMQDGGSATLRFTQTTEKELKQKLSALK
jgi:hypothetical protein